jgi:hypothetical protein
MGKYEKLRKKIRSPTGLNFTELRELNKLMRERLNVKKGVRHSWEF